jgi:hypothetical protein
MIVFYTASFTGKKSLQKYYDLVLKTIQSFESDIISPELGNYMEVLSKKRQAELSKDSRRLHYEAIRKGILASNVVIIEVSNEDFQLGHEATLALDQKKPVLCLSIYEDFSKKIRSPYFYAGKYNEYNIEELVGDFLTQSKKEQLSVRFNCFLKQAQIDHLRLQGELNGQTTSEYLRVLIDRDIASPD